MKRDVAAQALVEEGLSRLVEAGGGVSPADNRGRLWRMSFGDIVPLMAEGSQDQLDWMLAGIGVGLRAHARDAHPAGPGPGEVPMFRPDGTPTLDPGEAAVPESDLAACVAAAWSIVRGRLDEMLMAEPADDDPALAIFSDLSEADAMLARVALSAMCTAAFLSGSAAAERTRDYYVR